MWRQGRLSSASCNASIEEVTNVIHRKLAEEEEKEDLVERTPISARKIAKLLQLCLK